MNSLPVPPKLVPLISYLNALERRAPLGELQRLLAASAVTLADVRDFVRFEPTSYQRNLVALGPWYEVLVICWRSGQRSPIHNHAQSTCGLKVLQGVCTETYFAHAPCGQVVALSSHDCHAGHVCASEDEDTHQVSNLQSAGSDLVTIHIYSPPLRAMKKFSLTSAAAEEWRPPVFEFVHGEGI